PDSLSPDMGIRAWQVHDRSDLVVLSFLAAEISEHAVWTVVERARSADRGHLHSFRHRKHYRWLALFRIDQARLDHKSRTQECDVDLRVVGSTDRRSSECEQPLGCGCVDRPCHRRASGLVRKSLYPDI